MSPRRPTPSPEFRFRLRGAAVTFRATACGDAVRVEVIGLDDAARNDASDRLHAALTEDGLAAYPPSPAPQCRRLEVYGTDTASIRRKFAAIAKSLEGYKP